MNPVEISIIVVAVINMLFWSAVAIHRYRTDKGES